VMAAAIAYAFWVGRERARAYFGLMLFLTAAIVGGMVVTTLVYVSLFTWRTGAAKVVFGGETRADFLARSVYDYGAMRFIQTRLPLEARVLHLWDGQGYYCDERCVADAGQVQWVFVYQSGRTVDGVVAELSARGITHFLLDLEGLNFMLRHDPRGTHLGAARFFLDQFQPACAESIFEEPLVRLYRFTCSAAEAASPSLEGAPLLPAEVRGRLGLVERAGDRQQPLAGSSSR